MRTDDTPQLLQSSSSPTISPQVALSSCSLFQDDEGASAHLLDHGSQEGPELALGNASTRFEVTRSLEGERAAIKMMHPLDLSVRVYGGLCGLLEMTKLSMELLRY